MKMKMKIFIYALGLITLLNFGYALEKPGNSKKVIAHRLNESLILDGKLNESVYQNQPVTEFYQRDPDEGKPATEKTEVWVSYDDHNFYVSAKLYDSRPDSITKILGRRDKHLSSDYFGFAVDTYLDRRNAFFFLVNPAGSIIDGQFFNDGWQDETWDGIWDYAIAYFDSGWSVEIKIPFSQLRFKNENDLIWGINFYRRINRRNEESFFIYVPKKESGFVSHFATLEGLSGIKQKQRFEILPYIVGKAQYLVHDPLNPFYKQNQYLSNFGADYKIGLGSNLTIDGTFNPDFGQVEVDPAVVNLTAFETYFWEKRPFFIEGSQILRFGVGGSNNNFNFNWSNPQIFYSRRIGRKPRIDVSSEGFVDYPRETRILGAAKLTGKFSNDWSINFLNAFTERTFATIDFRGIRRKQEVEPFTYYGVLRTQKEFNAGKNSIGIISTATIRDNRDSIVNSTLVKQAFSFGVDGWTYLDKDEVYVLNGYLVNSYLKGSSESITRIQKAPQRYFQRPDANLFKLDTLRTDFSGYAGRLMLNKQKGNFFLNSAFGFISPTFEVNDIGFLTRADNINSHLVLGYRWFEPDGFTRSKSILFALFGNSDFEGNLTNKGVMTFGRVQFMNFYSFHFDLGYAPSVYQKELTRGGPLTKRPDAYWFSLNFESDESKDFVVEVNLHSENLTDGTKQINSEVSFEWKPNAQINFSVSPSFDYVMDKTQWVKNIEDSTASSTYGYRYIFARMIQRTISANFRLNWTFTPKLSLQLYAQPLFSIGKYDGFKELSEARTYNFKLYGVNEGTIKNLNGQYEIDPDGSGLITPFIIGNPDFNFKSLRVNLVLRWEFLPGSSLYFVWTHDRTNDENPGSFSINRDFKNLINSDSNNIFLIKLNYWLDI